MNITDLSKLCREYDLLKLDINTIEKNIENGKNYVSLAWAVKRDEEKLIQKNNRKKELEFIFLNIGDITI